MINGAHSIIFSSDPEADRAFFRDVLGLGYVDAGDGWLIFGLPPSEVALHPSDDDAPDNTHKLYFMCHDVEALLQTMELRSIETTPISDEGWGLVTEITLPSGTKLPVYQPRHERPESPAGRAKSAKKTSKRPLAVKKASKKAGKPSKAVKKAVSRAPAPKAKKKGARKKGKR